MMFLMHRWVDWELPKKLKEESSEKGRKCMKCGKKQAYITKLGFFFSSYYDFHKGWVDVEILDEVRRNVSLSHIRDYYL